MIQSEMQPGERREQYSRDVTYGTNSEFGFDYLRDSMANKLEEACSASTCSRSSTRSTTS